MELVVGHLPPVGETRGGQSCYKLVEILLGIMCSRNIIFKIDPNVMHSQETIKFGRSF